MKRKLLFFIGYDAGFFSEYNNMVLAMLYCHRNNIRFCLSSKNANFAYSRGWRDYFEPFCCELNIPYQRIMNPRLEAPLPTKGRREKIKRGIFRILKRLYGIDLLTYDIFNKARAQMVDEAFIDDCIAQNQFIWHYNKSTMQAIEIRKSVLSLPKEYVGIHIRRGDKCREIQHTDIQQYIDMVASHSKCKDVFVATDDYSVYEQLCLLYPNWRFYTLTSKSHQGYDQRTFEKYTKECKREEMILLFTDIEVLASSQLFVGTLSSNIGMYLYWRMPKGQCLGVDFQDWRIW